MADKGTVAKVKHWTLTGAQVDQVTIEDSTWYEVLIRVAATTDPLYITYGDENTTITAPTTAGDDNDVVPGLTGAFVLLKAWSPGRKTTIKVLSTGAHQISVGRVNNPTSNR
jgi:hypothetical protein